MKVLITGGSGQLGRALKRQARVNKQVVAVGSNELNLADTPAVEQFVRQVSPDLIIHAGAMTDVDGCEREPERAWRINALGTQSIAAAAQEVGARLAYISTNFVFDGESDAPYHEFADPRPISVYGASKLAGERAVQSLCQRHFIVRTAMVYDETGRNFVNTMLRLASTQPKLTVVADQFGNPTYAGDLAAAIWRLVETTAFGTYHLTNQGVTSWHGWASEIFRLTGHDIDVQPIPASAYQRPARPPRNGALANLAGQALGIELPDWQDALARCLSHRDKQASPQ